MRGASLGTRKKESSEHPCLLLTRESFLNNLSSEFDSEEAGEKGLQRIPKGASSYSTYGFFSETAPGRRAGTGTKRKKRRNIPERGESEFFVEAILFADEQRKI